MAELISSIVSKLLEYTTAPIARRVGYLVSYRSNLEKLKNEEEKLRHLRESVEHRVDAAVRNGEVIEDDIRTWLQDVDEIMAEAAALLDKDEGLAKTSCPNLTLRYQFRRRSKKLVVNLQKFRGDSNFVLVSRRAPISQLGPLRNSEKDFESRLSILEAIMEALKDPNLNMIGVYGQGGVGKTSLVQQVSRKVEQEKSFDVVVWVNVARNPDLKGIQQQIAASLGLNLEEESVYGRAARLRDTLMTEKSVLIILDDLWGKLELHEIGIPVSKQKENIKILMTSKSQEVLSHKMNTQKDFLLTTLVENEAWNLFKENAGLESTANPELLSIATEVAAVCAGLPIAIVTVARALKNKSQEEWRRALRELRGHALTDVTGTQDAITESKQDAIIKEEKEDIMKEITKNFEHLEDDVKSIFLLCGLIMGDNLAKSDLFKYSVGLGLFQDIDKMEDVRNKFDACIRMLEDFQLLQESNSRESLTMNGVVRNVTISLASKHKRHFIRRYQESEEWPDSDELINCRTIILTDHDINKHRQGLYCPNLRFFQLLKTDSSSKLPDNFFKGMRGLKVLDLTDDFFKWMSRLEVLDLTAVKFISGLPSSIIHLKNLTTLCLDYCVLEDIAYIGELKDLKFLSLSNSNIKKLPQELGQLTQLQFLDLSYCFQLEVIPPNVLSSLEKLEELYMLASFDDWDVNDPKKQQQSKASIVELTNLSCLTTLEVIIPDERMLPGPEDINRLFGSLKRGKVLMGRQLEFRHFFEYETSAALKLWLSSTVTENVKSLLACVDCLGIGNFEVANNIVPRINETGFPQLKYLCVEHNEIQCIADQSGNSNSIDLFPNLDSLVLLSLWNLEKLCSGPLMRQSFSRLKFITVKNCNKLKSLFSFSLVRGLPHLLEIRLESCYSMEGIVSDDGNAAIGMLQFPELRNLYLEHLPELIGFRCEEITGNNTLHTPVSLFSDKVMSPNLEILDIKWTKNLKTVWQCSQLLSNCFGKLKKIDIRFCMDLISIFPYQIISTIYCLETLTVAHCESLREIVMTEDNPLSTHASFSKQEIATIQVDDEEEIVFTKLKLLELDDLSSLGSFCSQPRTFKFPSLDKFIISKCPQIKKLFSGVLMAPVLKSVMKDGEEHWDGDLNTTMKQLFE